MLQPMAREVLARILPVAPTGAWVTREYTLPLHEGQIALDIEAFAKAHAETGEPHDHRSHDGRLPQAPLPSSARA
jgi:hypothetical protein